MARIEELVIQKVKTVRAERRWPRTGLTDYTDMSASLIADIENPKRRAEYSLSHLSIPTKVFDRSPRDFLPYAPIEDET